MIQQIENDVYDWTLISKFRDKMYKMPEYIRERVKNTLFCGLKITKNVSDDVYLVKHGDFVHYHGLVRCKNSWYCPYCSIRIMMKARSRIAVALDELWKAGFKAFMMTVTIPHFREMSCYEASEILINTWSKDAFGYAKSRKNPFSTFINECGVKHHVRVLEYTYGVNSWHPHLHLLIWVPGDKLQKVAEYEEKLRAYWEKRVRINMIRFWIQNHLHGATSDNVSINSVTGAITIRNEGETATVSCYNDVIEFVKKNGLRASSNRDAGNNRISNSGQYSTVLGGDDNDVITNSVEDVTIDGGDGNDTIRNTSQYVSISGGDGNDSIFNNADNVTINAEAGDDTINVVGSSSNLLISTPSDKPQLFTPAELDCNIWRALQNYFLQCENKQHHSIHISRRDDGTVSAMTSSNYLASLEGSSTWGGDNELASRTKTAAKGHYTPMQLLEKAVAGDDKAWLVFVDFIVAITEKLRPRVKWSKTGLFKLVQTAMKTEKYHEILKKKSTMYGELEIICSFSKEEWYKIYFNSWLMPNILYLATVDKRLLFEFLDGLGIKYRTNIHPFHQDRLRQIYADYAA